MTRGDLTLNLMGYYFGSYGVTSAEPGSANPNYAPTATYAALLQSSAQIRAQAYLDLTGA